jgi:hypothetical protein
MLVSTLYFNLGKKAGGQKEEQAAGEKPAKERSVEQQAGPAQPEQKQKQKKRVEPAPSTIGGDVTSGPSQQPQKPPTRVAGMEGGMQKGQAGRL